MVAPDRPGVETCFTGLAGTYAAHRPGYPPAVIDAVLADLPRPVRVADVGCGTGISTRLLADAGATVIGLDPNEDMLREAAAALPPSVELRRGTGEATGLADASVDVVLCAQSFHWFNAPVALAEFARILRPHGRLALVWNVRDTDHPLGAAYEAVVDRAQADARLRGLVVRDLRAGSPDESPWFDDSRIERFANPQRLDLARLLGRAQSASYFPRSGPLRDELEQTLRTTFETHAVDGTIDLPQRAELTLSVAAVRV